MNAARHTKGLEFENLMSTSIYLPGTNYESILTKILIAIATFLPTDPRRQRLQRRRTFPYRWWRSTRRRGWGRQRRHRSLVQLAGQTTRRGGGVGGSTDSQRKLADGAEKTEVLRERQLREAEVFPWFFCLRLALEFYFLTNFRLTQSAFHLHMMQLLFL